MKMRLTDFTMAYLEAGEGLPVLLIHGYPLSKNIWQPQLEGLASAARLIAPDLRGHGGSSATSGTYSMELLADDCHALLGALGIRPPVVVGGLSMGGYVAMAYARKYPAELAGLLLVATRAAADTPEARNNRLKAMESARQDGLEATFDNMLPKLLSPQTLAKNSQLAKRVHHIMAATSLQGVLGDLAGMRERPDAMEVLLGFKKPALIVHGEDDQIIPRVEAESMHAALSDSQLVVIPGAGHLPPLEQPEAFNQAVSGFLGHVTRR
ncbi:MAG: alpha/beta fold hydrolase [Anaerolineales bacterium]|nr:alpha/beta fold hydrolase [Anaerolineales bacterium]